MYPNGLYARSHSVVEGRPSYQGSGRLPKVSSAAAEDLGNK
jgi:hypothetical protein